ncbi:MAG: acetyl-CoA carboxylase biotin carboxyl carrier protein [bacterium]|nr:acetyl-CoA carboxylase biotin carboxyl carrier protein [bacterium]
MKELIDQVASHRLSGIEVERAGFRLKIDGRSLSEQSNSGSVHLSVPAVSTDGQPAAPDTAPAPAAPPPAAKAEPEAAEEAPPADQHVLHSPIVGTFYRSPNPESPAYVEVGARVKKGQVLCIVEAMKLMNEIESDVDGVVTKIYVENAQPVEYGESLFAIKEG